MPIIKKKREVGKNVVAELDGPIDSDNCQLLRDELNGLIDVGYSRILLDYSNVNFVSSAGLGVLIRFAQRLEEIADSKLCLCSLDERVESVFQVAGITQFFEIFTDHEEALSSMSKQES
jgi:anti-anti-sigma factor